MVIKEAAYVEVEDEKGEVMNPARRLTFRFLSLPIPSRFRWLRTLS